MTHGRHIYETASDMAMATTCAYPLSQYSFPHCKYVLYCFSKCPRIYLPSQELDRHRSNTCPKITFHVFHLIARCVIHQRCLLENNKIFCLCLCGPAFVPPAKL